MVTRGHGCGMRFRPLPAHIRVEVARASIGKPGADTPSPEKKPDGDLNFEQFRDYRNTAIAETNKLSSQLMDISRRKLIRQPISPVCHDPACIIF